jgi:hypothetical protein
LIASGANAGRILIAAVSDADAISMDARWFRFPRLKFTIPRRIRSSRARRCAARPAMWSRCSCRLDRLGMKHLID